jgi:hypothetical protein
VLEQHLRAAELGSAEVLGSENRTVDVGLGGEVDDRSAALGGLRDVSRLGNVPVMELDPVRQVRAVARVRELVEDDDVVAKREPSLDELRPDEAGAPRRERTGPRLVRDRGRASRVKGAGIRSSCADSVGSSEEEPSHGAGREQKNRATSDGCTQGSAQQVKDGGIDDVPLWFTDLEGHLKSFSITISERRARRRHGLR